MTERQLMDRRKTRDTKRGPLPGIERETRKFDPGLDVRLRPDSLGFDLGMGVRGPEAERRALDAIRPSLLDPKCSGPDPVYAVAMDVGLEHQMEETKRRMLLFGVMVLAAGRLGREPVRSQGHVHAKAPHSGWSPPELIEIWEGQAVVYLQKSTDDDPVACIAVKAAPGEVVVVPPGWAHGIINVDPNTRMVFGAWCDRQYGFVYDGVRARGGLAWFPILSDQDGRIHWEPNPSYKTTSLTVRHARAYPELGLSGRTPIYQQFANDPGSMQWVSEPAQLASLWNAFEP